MLLLWFSHSTHTAKREDKLLPLFSFRCDTLLLHRHLLHTSVPSKLPHARISTFGLPDGNCVAKVFAMSLCMQGCNLKVHYKISTLRFAEVVFCSETLHT